MGRYIRNQMGKVSSWEKEEVGVEWIFDVSKKEWPGVKDKLGSMENILFLIEFREQ